jgi:lipopolysaccharide transport system permease protein
MGLTSDAIPRSAAARDVPDTVPRGALRIAPGRPGFAKELVELWRYRELFGFLVWRDLKVRYVQTVLGPLWAIVVPLLQMVVFTVIFARLGGIQGEYHVPYPLFVFCGLLPWTYFSSLLNQSAKSVVTNTNLVTKVYVPRLMLPIASIAVPLVDFAIAFVVLLCMFAGYQRAPHWHTVLVPFFLGLALLTGFGIGLWLSALNVRYRDIPYVIPLLTQLWLFASPVLYGTSFIPPDWHWLIALNPVTGVIDGFRWAVLGRGLPHYDLFATSLVVGLALTVSGVMYFRHVERRFADVI